MKPIDRVDPRTGKDAGFTVMELVIVLTLGGLILAIALPDIDTGRAQVNGGALALTSRLMTAQRISVLKQHDVRLSFDIAERAITSHEDLNNDGELDDGESLTRWELEEGVVFGRGSAPALLGHLPAVDLEDGDNGLPTLSFHRNGSTSQEGYIYLTARNGQDLHARAIRTDRATGGVECWSYRTGDWSRGC